MYKFKVGDEIQVTSGRDKGKKGKIEKIFKTENRLIVSGVNVYKRHRKVSRNQPAGIYEIARPLPIANIALVCPKCNKLTRVEFRVVKNEKNRVCKKCKGAIS